MRAWGIVLLVLFAAGCNPQARHAVLSTLFDGVPPYVSPEERVRLKAEAAEQAAREAELARRLALYGTVKKSNVFTHGPYAAEECFRCHTQALNVPSGSSKERRTASSDRRKPTIRAGEGTLKLPVTELCGNCHVDFGLDRTSEEGLWLHGPVASGWCVKCHNPHDSRYANLVLAEPSAALCERCHNAADLVAFTQEHSPATPEEMYPPPEKIHSAHSPNRNDEPSSEIVRVVKDCTRCHNPHFGRDRFLLRSEIGAVERKSDAGGSSPPAENLL